MPNIKLYSKAFFMIFSLLAIYNKAAFAEDIICDLKPVHISATLTIRLSKYGENYPINRGELQIGDMKNIEITNCHYDIGGVFYYITAGAYRIRSSIQLVSNSSGESVLPIENSADQNKLAIGLNFADPTPTYFDTQDQYVARGYSSTDKVANLQVRASISNLANWVDPQAVSTVTYNISQPLASVSIKQSGGEDITRYIDAVFLDNLTVNYIVSSCGINAKQGSVVNWPALTKGDIRSGIAAAKPYNLTLICGNAADTPSAVNITFTSSNGFADAAGGVVKTNLPNVGLKLSWVNPALPPLVLDQVNHSTLAGIGDYSVMAKPVKTSAIATDVIEAGHFDTNVTMNIEFP